MTTNYDMFLYLIFQELAATFQRQMKASSLDFSSPTQIGEHSISAIIMAFYVSCASSISTAPLSPQCNSFS